MRHVHQAASLVFVLFGAYVVAEAHGMVLYTDMGPGNGFFPFWLGIVFVALSVIWLGQVSLRPLPVSNTPLLPSRAGVWRVGSILGALALFILLVSSVGFQLSMFGLLLFLLTALGRQNLLLTFVVSITGSFGVYYVFTNWLDVRLPASSIELLAGVGL